MKDGICPCEEGAVCRFVCDQCQILYAHLREQNHPNRSMCVSQVGDQADFLLLAAFHNGEADEHPAR